MKINRIICDICNNEIDINIDAGIAMYEHIVVQPKLDFVPNLFSKENNNIKSDKEIIKKSFDICKNCAKEIDILIDKLKEKKLIPKVVKK